MKTRRYPSWKLLPLAIILSIQAYAQAPDWQWGIGIGGTDFDGATAIEVDKYNNIYAAGSFDGIVDFDPGPAVLLLNSQIDGDAFITKYDPLGNLIWVKTWNGYITDIVLDTLCSLYLAGSFSWTMDMDPGSGVFSVNSSGSADIFITKLDSAGNFIYGRFMGGIDTEGCEAIAIDDTGNVLMTGSFKGTCDFDPDTNSQYLLTSNGDRDAFVLKLDVGGNLLWARSMGGSSIDKGNSIAFDDSGNVYSTGYFNGVVDLDPGTGVYNLGISATKSIYISKLNPAGNLEWARAFENARQYSDPNALITGAGGSIYVTGNFQGSVDFDPDPGFNFIMNAGSYCDAYVTKLDNNGHLIWAKKIGSSTNGYDKSVHMVKDHAENLYITGSCNYLCDFDPGPGTFYVNTLFSIAAFICKWDSTGQFKWAQSITNAGVVYGNSCAVDATQHASVVCEFYHNPLSIGPDTIYNQGANPYFETSDVVIARLSCLSASNVNISACNSYTSPSGKYTWNVPGTYVDTLITGFGCDSIITINLSIGMVSSASTQNIIACNSYISPSNHYSWAASGTYLDTIPNAAGCDSVMTINLTISNSSSSSHTDTACGSFLSPGGLTWTTTGIHHDTIPNAAGCDSIITVDLTVLNHEFSDTTIQNCISYLSPSGLFLWTLSGDYTDTIPTINGCDSVITFHLTIQNINTTVVQNGMTLMAQAVSASYQWLDCNNGFAPIINATGNSFTPPTAGSYAVEVIQDGCKDTSACFTLTGVNDNIAQPASSFEILPNPAGADFMIIFAVAPVSAEIEFYDIAGKTVYSSTDLSGQELKMTTEEFPEGVYFVRIKTDRYAATKKLVISR